ncbi:MAG: 1-acyl-sn-glycerol-3-phosphate acyltransferase [Clostridia bacterium]|nr:1-acyl-sn-glycerol-3-phosphate acyltransferase [Clostridia bacterium]
MKQAKKKNKKWMKFRHKVVHLILRHPVHLLCKIKYGIKIKKYPHKEPCLVLYNHQTAFDQFFVGLAFRQPIYYLASEDLFSNGWVSSLIKYLVEPIPIKKQTTDVKAILNCIRVIREGGSIAIAPEGNRTYSGETVFMSPTIAPLARKMGVPIVLYRLEGGYGVQPRWSDVTRKGKMCGYVSRVIKPEEYNNLSDDELFDIIRTGLYQNEAVADAQFKHKKLAEYVERAIYTCPDCGLTTIESNGDVIECKRCGKKVRYLPTKELKGINCDFPHKFMLDWYKAQENFVNSLDLTPYHDTPMYEDHAEVKEVIAGVSKTLLYPQADITLYGNRINISYKEGDAQQDFLFDETTAVTVLGRNKLNIYHGGKIYQLKGDKRFCALKFVHIFHRYKNILKGDENDTFLGL